MVPPSIFEFTTIESFLAKHFYFRKAQNPRFSYAVWAHRLKIKTPSSLCMMIKGNRLPSPELRQKLKLDLGLNERESRYFDLLIDMKKYGHDVIRSVEIFKELESTHPQKGFRLIEQDQFRAISNWYHYALLEAVEVKGFKENHTYLSTQFEFAVSESEIQEAIQTLLRLGLLARDKKGKLIRVPGPVITHSDQSDEALKQFHEQTLENAKRALRSQTSSDREFQGLSLLVKESRIPEAKKRLRNFIKDFCHEFDAGDRSDQVYQLEICLFRLMNLKLDQELQKLRPISISKK